MATDRKKSDGPIRLAVAGAAGRMGRSTLALASADPRFVIAAALVGPDDSRRGAELVRGGEPVFPSILLEAACDALIDFSTPAGTMQWLECCVLRNIPMVIGTTGHDMEQAQRIKAAAGHVPIVQAANCSVGIQAVTAVLARLIADLGPEYDVELVETHHRGKRDVPSGTAWALVDEVLRLTGRTREGSVMIGRNADAGPRKTGTIAVHSVRLGDVVGRHEIHVSGPGETISITHEAHSRETFAAGALRAAAWVSRAAPGLHTMRDVLNER